MKTFLLSIVIAVSGATLGVVSTFLSYTTDFVPAPRSVGSSGRVARVLPPASASTPTIEVVGGSTFDFGSMEVNAVRKHEFTLRNPGTTTVSLEKGTTTCKCTMSELKGSRLEPGASTTVELEWHPKAFDPEFRQSAEIHVQNDRGEILESLQLIVRGKVLMNLRSVPDDAVFTDASASEGGSVRLLVYSYLSDKFGITGHELVDQETAAFYDVRVEPLSKDELASEQRAQAGYAVTVTLKPGLPLGPIAQTIRLRTDVEARPELEIPVRGNVIGDLTLFGRDYYPEKGVLQLGLVRAEGKRTTVNLIVKGKHRDATHVTVKSVDPADVLRATLGERAVSGNGKSVRIPLTVEVPPRSRTLQRLGGTRGEPGQIVLETTHPDTKSLTVHVHFAVEETRR